MSDDFDSQGSEGTAETDISDGGETELFESDAQDDELFESEPGDDAELYTEGDAEDGVSPEVRAEINEKSDYSSEVNDNIKSVEELEIYQDAGLHEETVDGRSCLVRDDIDWDQTDEFGDTNRSRVEKNLVPIAPNGEKIELHHVGQKDDSPLAELTRSEHRGVGNDAILHDKTKESEIDRPAFTTERIRHWKARD